MYLITNDQEMLSEFIRIFVSSRIIHCQESNSLQNINLHPLINVLIVLLFENIVLDTCTYFMHVDSAILYMYFVKVIKSCWMDFAKVDKTENIDIQTLELSFSKEETTKKTTTKQGELCLYNTYPDMLILGINAYHISLCNTDPLFGI